MRIFVDATQKCWRWLAVGLLALLLWATPLLALADDDAADAAVPAEQTENADEQPAPAEEPATEEPGEEEPTAEEPVEEPGAEEPAANEPNVAANTVKLTLGSKTAVFMGESMPIDVAPFATEGTTMLPLRFIAQDVLQAAVEWDNATNVVRVSRQGVSVTIVLESGKVYAAGQPYDMPVAPMVVDNRTLVPLRLISELMNCTVDYNSADKSILVTLPLPQNAEPPLADIEYLPATAGQNIEYIDKSVDPMGYAITEREWEVIDAEGNAKTGTSLYWLFYQKQGGDYTINYRVKNVAGLWSEPVSTEYHLEMNEKPEVTSLDAAKTSVDIGETIDVSYEIWNEDWEEVPVVNFTYTFTDKDGQSVTKRGLPAAFFISGTTTLNLSVQDAFGQWSDEVSLEFEVSDEVRETEAEYRFHHLNPGEIYLNLAKTNLNGLLSAKATKLTTENVTLLDSNSPEKVHGSNVLYSDVVTGRATLHYHHLNDSRLPLNIYMIAHNETDQPITMTLGRQGFAGPSSDPMQVGFIETQNYLSSPNSGQQITLQPGGMYLLNAAQKTTLKPDNLQSALVDVTTDGPLTVTVVSMMAGADYRTYNTLPDAAAVEPQTRGTYANAVYDIYIDLSGEDAEKIMVGYPDSFSGMLENYMITGTDRLTNSETYNKGNYGVIQRLHIKAAERCGVLVNPRGAIFRGAMLWNDELCLLSATGQIKTPQESVVAGIIEAGEEVVITYITPDGSDSPVLFVAIPEELWPEY